MFERLSDGFGNLFRKLSGKAEISESNVREAMEDVRRALIDADVNQTVVDKFTADVLADAVGTKVTKSLEPGQEMIGIVHRRLVELLGGEPAAETAETQTSPLAAGLPAGVPKIAGLTAPAKASGGALAEPIMRIAPGPTIVMMSGLQGSGKTTTCGKLAAYLRRKNRSVMLAAADLQRPAAVDQLRTVAESVKEAVPVGAAVHFYGEPDKCAEYGKAVGVAVGVCQRALAEARRLNIDVLILDTAGRLHVNDELMGELAQVNRALTPHHIFLVVDAMTGQDAVQSAKAFHQRLQIDGVILTKFDSDTRGGAALSVKQVTGAPIKFIGTGEKIDALEEFHADRIAGRILGMGDVVSLVEKAQSEVSEEEAQRLNDKLAKGEMNMEDFLGQLKTLRRMGPLKNLLGMLPGVGSMMKDVQVDEKQIDRVEAMISSMTRHERTRPSVIDLSRRRRIATGAGTSHEEVGTLVKQCDAMNKISRTMGSMNSADKIKAVKELQASGGMGGMVPGIKGLPGLRTGGSTYTPSIKSKFKKRK